MPICDLRLRDLGPFDDIYFEFDSRVNVFVGPNNCGKSTVLAALGGIAVYAFIVPPKLYRKESPEYETHIIPVGSQRRELFRGRFSSRLTESQTVGFTKLGFSCFVPALRLNLDYRAKSALKKSRKPPEGNDELVIDELLEEEETKIREQPVVVRDEVLTQRIVDLDYRSYREGNPAIRKLIDKIASVASEITDGFPITFVGVQEDDNGLFLGFSTPDGKVPINVLSQGTQSILQWLGLLLIGYAEHYHFPDDLPAKPGVVIIDEIDAHMHPSWQRRILPALVKHFPNLQIFCSTHSPLVLAGLNAGQAHLLKRDEKGKVTVSRNEKDIVGWSTDEILRTFLDITNPTDLKTHNNIERLQELRSKDRLTPKEREELERLRETVGHDLLAGPVATEIERFAEILQKGPAGPASPKTRTPKKQRDAAGSRGRTRTTPTRTPR